MKNRSFIILFCLVSTLFALPTMAQSVFDDLNDDGPLSSTPNDLVEERIDKISISRRIFIITNRNSSFSRGDFISLLLEDNLVARGLVAETTNDGLAAVKIVKIYDSEKWPLLVKDKTIQVLRGDDSYYQRLMNDESLPEDMNLIEDEDDLFDESTFLEDDLLLEDKSNRILKNDHLLSVYLGFYEGIDNAENPTRYQQFNAAYAYQIEENIFVEGAYGRNLINDFPTGGLDTLLQNFTFRAKYVVKAPYFSFILPYVGYQLVTASSDDAGQPGDNTTPEGLERELLLVDEQEQNRPVFGVTLIKRLVPGWFIRAGLGNDQLGVGLSLEF